MIDQHPQAGQERIKSADRVLDVFEALGGEPGGLSFPDLIKRLGVPKSSLHGLLSILVNRQYLVFDEATRHYFLGVQIFEHGQSFLQHHQEAREAKATMEAIVAQVNETVQLAMLRGSESINLAKVDCAHMLRLQSEVGKHFSAHATSLGKVLLAHLPEGEVRARFGSGDLPRYTEHTFVRMDDLLAELARIRERGFSFDTEEYTSGVFCVGVPIFNHALQALTGLSVTIPTSRLTSDLLARCLANLAAGSLAISARMGARQRSPELVRLSVIENAAAALNGTQARNWIDRAR